MNIKYPYSKFLLPAGFLPILVPYSIFKYYEELRSGHYSNGFPLAAGFEYLYLVDQDTKLVNSSLIKGKIVGVHGPLTEIDNAPTLETKILSTLIFKPKVAADVYTSAKKTCDFAKKVGAEYVVFHTIDFDVNDPEKFVDFLKNEVSPLKLFLECDLKKPNLNDWYYDGPALYKKFKVSIVFDTATIECNGQDPQTEWLKLEKLKAVGLIHLNEYLFQMKKDKGILRSPKYEELIKQISNSKFQGYINFEIDPIQNPMDKILAGFYLLACLMGITTMFPRISELYAGKSQKNLYESVIFTAKYLT